MTNNIIGPLEEGSDQVIFCESFGEFTLFPDISIFCLDFLYFLSLICLQCDSAQFSKVYFEKIQEIENRITDVLVPLSLSRFVSHFDAISYLISLIFFPASLQYYFPTLKHFSSSLKGWTDTFFIIFSLQCIQTFGMGF